MHIQNAFAKLLQAINNITGKSHDI